MVSKAKSFLSEVSSLRVKVFLTIIFIFAISSIDQAELIPIEETTNEFILRSIYSFSFTALLLELAVIGIKRIYKKELSLKTKDKSKMSTALKVLQPNASRFFAVTLGLTLLNYSTYQAATTRVPEMSEYLAILLFVAYILERFWFLLRYIFSKFYSHKSIKAKSWSSRSFMHKMSSIRVRYAIGALSVITFFTNNEGEGGMNMLNLTLSLLTGLIVVSVVVAVVHSLKK